MKYTKNFNRDYQFYLDNSNNFSFAADYYPIITLDTKGKSAKECFWLLDSQSISVPCSQPEELTKVLLCKKSVNFHIKLWAENYLDILEPIEYYLEEFIDPPDWIEKSLVNQINKLHRKRMLTDYFFLCLDLIKGKYDSIAI
jgi:hypothetical protein